MMASRQIGGFLVFFRCATVLLTLMAVLLTLMEVTLRVQIAHQTQFRQLKAQQSPTAYAMLAGTETPLQDAHAARRTLRRPWAAPTE